MRASAWRIRTAPVEIPAEALPAEEPPPAPEQGAEVEFFPTGQELGYHTAMECRFVEGGFVEPGPATVWLRMRQPLVAGEEPTPLQRVLVTADVGNGVSAALDYRRYLFINVDLTVHLERMPEGEWVCVDAVTLPQPNGVGTAESVLSDRRGRIGRALQTLLDRPALGVRGAGRRSRPGRRLRGPIAIAIRAAQPSAIAAPSRKEPS